MSYQSIIKFEKFATTILKHYIYHLNFYYSVLEQLHGKTIVMSLLGHADHNVRYEALLAVQKLMVHNW